MIIQMVDHVSGGRHDGRPWPPAWTDFEVPDWEGADLVRAKIAVEIRREAPPSQRMQEQEIPEDPAPVVDDPAAVVEDPAPGEQEDVPPAAPADPPQPSDPKQVWTDYAISQGIDPAMASAWTKQRLMAEFGGRL